MVTSAPIVGSRIKVETIFGAYEGTVVPNLPPDPTGSFCITCDEFIDNRNIMLKNVRSIVVLSGASGKFWKVRNKGKTYLVSRVASRWSCTCTGFTYRKTCKHIGGAKRLYEQAS